MKRFSTRRTLVTAITVIAMVFASGSAFAQDNNGGGGAAGTGFGTSTTTTTTLGIIITIGGPILTTVLAAGGGKKSSMREQRRRFVAHVLEQNAASVRQALALGGGEATSDLGQTFFVEESDLGAFGKLLRSNRKQLLPLLDGEKIDEATAEAFMNVVEGAMSSNKNLSDDLERLRAFDRGEIG